MDSLPSWGPYSKRHAGISHIPDVGAGLRFDLSVFPAQYRGRTEVPGALWESGWQPREAAPDFSWFSNRHQLEWRDRVYADVGFAELEGNARLIRCECVNNTDAPQNLALHFMASMHFPPLGPYQDQPIQMVRPVLPPGGMWIGALDYCTLRFAQPRPSDNLVYENWLRGEVRAHGFSGGTGLGQGFARDAGDEATYLTTLDRELAEATLLLRYRTSGETRLRVVLAGGHRLVLDCRPEPDAFGFRVHRLPIASLPAGLHEWKIQSHGGAPLELDGFVIAGADAADSVGFEPRVWGHKPDETAGPDSVILKWPDAAAHFGLRWDFEPSALRHFHCRDLEVTLPRNVHSHVTMDFYGEGQGHFTNVFLSPILLGPNSRRVVYGLVCAGTREQVRRQLEGFDFADAGALCESRRPAPLVCTPAGEPDRFSQERMAATILTNVVYPVYTRRTYIRHHTPGKIWDCLYTWDSGFIGLGLMEVDIPRAVECLKTYLTDPGDTHAAFVHHGTPLPVQASLFLELWNRTRSREMLEFAYPRLLQWHRFLCGRLGSSTTRRLGSGLISTWDYFYNSGGWDDYPAQMHVHAAHLENRVAPVVNTAHSIRMAKTLRMAAMELGRNDDMDEYDQDITSLSAALHHHSWDEESGYFGYVQHSKENQPDGIMRHTSGRNFNMGLDGVSPLVAGICTPGQTTRLLTHLFSPGRLWTPIGLTTVDQAAPYFRSDGYWNGAVWMPHQWFLWKAMLDQGKPDLAWQIARTALDVWQREVGESHHCFEHFIVQSGRGAGWHQFGGLSAPVLNWFAAYYRPGTLTTGFDVWVKDSRFGPALDSLDARLALHATDGTHGCVLVAMDPSHDYTARWNGNVIPANTRLPGLLEISLPIGPQTGNLKITHA